MLRLTSLGRSLPPWRPAPAWALFAMFVVGVSSAISHGPSSGVRGALTVLLAWAITRELAPGRAVASFLAPFAAVVFAIPAEGDLLACVAVLFAARIATRSVGDSPTLLDLALLVPFAGWAATRPVGLPAALVLAAIVFADAPSRHARLTRIAGVAALGAAIGVGALEGTLTFRPGWDDPVLAEQVLLATTAVAALALVLVRVPARLRLRDDRRRGRLAGARVRGARVAVLAAVLAAVAWTGIDGAFGLSAASAALLAAGLGGGRLRGADPG